MTADAERPPKEVIQAFGLEQADLEPIAIGLVNRTFRVRIEGEPRLILQRLHPAFRGEVNLDLETIAAHVESRGMLTPRLVRTRDGRAWIDHEGLAWRAITHLDGETLPRITDPHLARETARLAGRFHRALEGFAHTFHFTRPGAHDTPAHLRRLEAALASHRDHPSLARVQPIAEAILAHRLPAVPLTRTRIIHGDLKITNILFDRAHEHAIALLDLDTLQHGTLAIEMGDALRSWCNPAGEIAEAVRVDHDIFTQAIDGYAEVMRGGVDAEEIDSLVGGFETIALELSSRFALDALEDRYFAWDAARYASRSDHNLARAAGQLALARSVAAQRDFLSAIVRSAFR